MYQQIINFFKKHNLYEEHLFKYIHSKTNYVDYYNEMENFLIGCYIKTKNDRIIDLMLYIPYLVDKKTMLITVHELTHAIGTYYQIGTIYQETATKEVLPILMEHLFVLESNDPELEQFERFLDDIEKTEANYPYLLALILKDKLIEEYQNEDIKKLNKKIKKLAKKY